MGIEFGDCLCRDLSTSYFHNIFVSCVIVRCAALYSNKCLKLFCIFSLLFLSASFKQF